MAFACGTTFPCEPFKLCLQDAGNSLRYQVNEMYSERPRAHSKDVAPLRLTLMAYYCMCNCKRSLQSQEFQTRSPRQRTHRDVVTPRRFEFLKHRRLTEPIKALENSTSLGCLGLVAMIAQTAGNAGTLGAPTVPGQCAAAGSVARVLQSRSRYLEMIRLIQYRVDVRPIPNLPPKTLVIRPDGRS